MIKKVVFEVETITPMFLAGADQGKVELRVASIKGLLRFWWRALQAESDIEKLRNRESQIFGSSDEKTGGGSSFAIRIIPNSDLKPTKNKFPTNSQYQISVEGKTFKINILEYLAYGTEYIQRQGNVFTREHYPAKTKFDIAVSFTDEAWENEVLKTFYVWSIFGGIGSRSRNGFGSFDVLNKEKAFEDIKEVVSIKTPYIKGNIEKLVKKENIVSYSSFARGTKLFKAKNSFDSGLDSLADVGKTYKNGRSGLERRHCFDKRQYIGAPIVEEKVTKSLLDRHSKPYFIKIAKEGNKYRAYILYLPSKYCDGLEKDRNGGNINHSVVDKTFAAVCGEFNAFLSKHMEIIL
jgi:CRISPR-associated protein Cmr1